MGLRRFLVVSLPRSVRNVGRVLVRRVKLIVINACRPTRILALPFASHLCLARKWWTGFVMHRRIWLSEAGQHYSLPKTADSLADVMCAGGTLRLLLAIVFG